MKNVKFIKFNILTLALLILLGGVNFAAVIYSPGTEGTSPSPLNDPALNQYSAPQNESSQVSADAAAIISQIVIKDTNAATQVSSPQAINTTQSSVGTAPGATSVSPTTLTEFKVTGEKEPQLSAPAYILINTTTNHIYTSKDKDTRYEPAGLANLLTAYIATQKFSMDSVLTVNSTAVTGVDKDAAIAALNAGDTITLKDALASMFVKGCVDSANVVAENVSGSIEEFVKLMNETARVLGLTNSNFVNPSGITSSAQQSSALDMAIVMSKCCENPELVKLLALPQYTLPAAKKRDKLIIYSRNTQLSNGSSSYNADVAASRLGYNSKAMYCIASMMNYNNNKIIAVVLKANGSQFSDTKKLFEYGKIACAQDTYQ